jgi:hypothetical protein
VPIEVGAADEKICHVWSESCCESGTETL